MATSIDALIKIAEDLVKFSPTAMEISRLAGDEDATMNDLVVAIEADPGIAAHLLRIANSPTYRRGEPTLAINQAVLRVGRRELGQLAFAMACMGGMAPLDCALMRMQTLLRDGVLVGGLARELSGLAPGAKDAAFAAGMLHAIGSAVMSYAAPEETEQALSLSLDFDLPLHEAERQAFDFDHAQLGGALARAWDFPEPLIMAIEFQHAPREAPDHHETVMVVAIASAMLEHALEINEMDEDSSPLKALLDELDMADAFDQAGIDPDQLWQRVHEAAAA